MFLISSLKRSSKNIQNLPFLFETSNEDASYQDYALLGRNKKTNQIEQINIFRISKEDIYGNLSDECIRNLAEIYSDLTLYKVDVYTKMTKMSDNSMKKLLK